MTEHDEAIIRGLFKALEKRLESIERHLEVVAPAVTNLSIRMEGQREALATAAARVAQVEAALKTMARRDGRT